MHYFSYINRVSLLPIFLFQLLSFYVNFLVFLVFDELYCFAVDKIIKYCAKIAISYIVSMRTVELNHIGNPIKLP